MQMGFTDNKTAAFYASSSSDAVLAALKSRSGGLAPSEIRLRLLEYGANALIYALPLRAMFGLAPLAPVHWLLLLTFGPLLLFFEECRKALRRRLAVRPLNPAPATQL